MIKIDKDILEQVEDMYSSKEEDYENMDSWAEAVGEGFNQDQERKEIVKYVKERLEKINRYKSDFIKGKEAERLIKQLCRRAGVKSAEDIDDTVLKDIIFDIVDTYKIDSPSTLLYSNPYKKNK